mgnify:CR=1 FL=1
MARTTADIVANYSIHDPCLRRGTQHCRPWLIAEILQVLPEAACLPGDPFGITTIICSALPSVIRLSMTEETTSPLRIRHSAGLPPLGAEASTEWQSLQTFIHDTFYQKLTLIPNCACIGRIYVPAMSVPAYWEPSVTSSEPGTCPPGQV